MDGDFIGRAIGPDGRYLIRRRLGEGGCGVVYEAWEEARNRSVAVKFLLEGVNDPEVTKRFHREGKIFNRIEHPNIVRIYGMGRAAQLLYIASEFVDGETLYDVQKRKKIFDIDEALEIVEIIAGALQAAHDNQVIHRDLKPENVMITRDGVLKVLDFGIAKDLNASVALTMKGHYVGTPAYSSPEQVKGLEIDHRSDIFSLGVMLYELVTGELPFKGRRTTEVLVNTIKADPVHPTRINREISTPVARLIARMIAKKPQRRLSSCHEVQKEIESARAALAEGVSGEEKRGIIGFIRGIFGGDTAEG